MLMIIVLFNLHFLKVLKTRVPPRKKVLRANHVPPMRKQ